MPDTYSSGSYRVNVMLERGYQPKAFDDNVEGNSTEGAGEMEVDVEPGDQDDVPGDGGSDADEGSED